MNQVSSKTNGYKRKPEEIGQTFCMVQARIDSHLDETKISCLDNLNSRETDCGPINLTKKTKSLASLVETRALLKYSEPTGHREKSVEASEPKFESKINECSICHKQFQYRSSYRRHMKIHQGIFSHLCDVCNRKFTRKEHYLRHKCNRRPNKPNRAGSENSSMKVTIPHNDMDDSSVHDTECNSPDSPKNINLPNKSSKLESRRKSNKPRKIITSIVSCSPTGMSDSGNEDEATQDVCFGVHTKKSPQTLGSVHWSDHKDEDPVITDSALPPVLNGSDPGNDLEESVLTLDSGSYKVQAVSSPSQKNPVDDDSNAFIKVVKQGNYLKLKNQMHVVSGKLCFVCPNCHKIFHRSSNFSRHMRIHRGIYSYVCPTCHRGFFRKEHYQKHKCHRKSMSHIWNRKTKIDLDMFSSNVEDNFSSSNNDSEAGVDMDPQNESGESQLDNDSGSVLSCDGKDSVL